MTELGIIGDAAPVRVTPSGALEPLDGVARVEIWVGADDRWHRPDAVAAVRQSADGGSPIVETRVRVPGGDIVQRVAVVPHQGGALARVVVTNETPVPVAIALAVVGGAGAGCYEDVVRVDGNQVLRLSRPVARFAVAATPDALEAEVESGHAVPPAELDGELRGGSAAAIVPLPHSAELSFVVSLAGHPVVPAPALPAPDAIPDFDAVGRGWDLHLESGARFAGPDDRVEAAVAVALRHLLVASAQPTDGPFWADAPSWAPAAAAVALHHWGHVGAARELAVQATAAARPSDLDRSGSLLWAWSSVLGPDADSGMIEALRAWSPDAVGRLLAARPGRLARRRPGNRPWPLLGLAAAPRVLSLAGDGDLAADVAEALPRLLANAEPAADPIVAALGGQLVGASGIAADVLAALNGYMTHTRQSTGSLADTLRAAGATGTFGTSSRRHDPAASALFAIALGRLLVSEPDGIGGPIDLLPGVPESWLGSPMQVHGVPVGGGVIEFGVRWHGPRPALLWDTALDRPARLMASGLDPSFSDDRPSGEALLGATEGLAVEAGPESPPVRRGDTLDADPDNPSSFQ